MNFKTKTSFFLMLSFCRRTALAAQLSALALLLATTMLWSCHKVSSAERPTLTPIANRDSTQHERYQYAPFPSADGIGKIYMGREIAKVMGHLGAMWLERPERFVEERPDLVLEAMQLKPTDVVADIGAGTGYFTFRLAERVRQGKVYAVDIQPEMLEIIKARMQARHVQNVIPTLGSPQNPNLPENAIDIVLLVDAYHEFEYPFEMMQALVRSLKVGGRVIQIEYRAEDDAVPIKPLHKMSEAQAKKEMHAVGLKWLATQSSLPWQHIFIFEKPAP